MRLIFKPFKNKRAEDEEMDFIKLAISMAVTAVIITIICFCIHWVVNSTNRVSDISVTNLQKSQNSIVEP